MWIKTQFEEHIEERLRAELGQAKGESMFAGFVVTRDKLVYNVFDEIAGANRDLTDHSADHVANVLENARSLLSADYSIHKLTAIDLYCLGMAILFHDVGNLFGRDGHHNLIGDIFDWARGTDASVRREKTLILRIARAHTGIAADGSNDTLKEVDEMDQIYGKNVRLREVAAILRFADELAEGPHRTSEYKRLRNLIEEDNRIFNDYASVTNILADRGTERVLATYEIVVDGSPETPMEAREEKLARLLGFIYERVIKLDQERRYARFYSDALGPFKTTHVMFNFHFNGEIHDLDLAPIQLDDKVVPGDPARAIPHLDKEYAIETLAARVVELASGGKK